MTSSGGASFGWRFLPLGTGGTAAPPSTSSLCGLPGRGAGASRTLPLRLYRTMRACARRTS
eukprot:5707480-Alexandrium_andersonii.AAC.1